jgi:hypothetical protein
MPLCFCVLPLWNVKLNNIYVKIVNNIYVRIVNNIYVRIVCTLAM